MRRSCCRPSMPLRSMWMESSRTASPSRRSPPDSIYPPIDKTSGGKVYFQTVSLLSFLTDQEIAEIEPLVIEQQYEKGEFVFREGDKAVWFYFLKTGAVKWW